MILLLLLLKDNKFFHVTFLQFVMNFLKASLSLPHQIPATVKSAVQFQLSTSCKHEGQAQKDPNLILLKITLLIFIIISGDPKKLQL